VVVGHGEIVTASLISSFFDETERHIGFLFESSRLGKKLDYRSVCVARSKLCAGNWVEETEEGLLWEINHRDWMRGISSESDYS
jgi:hypothetical protein